MGKDSEKSNISRNHKNNNLKQHTINQKIKTYTLILDLKH